MKQVNGSYKQAIDKCRERQHLTRRSSSLWSQPAVLLMIPALCGLAIYWWMTHPEKIDWYANTKHLFEEARKHATVWIDEAFQQEAPQLLTRINEENKPDLSQEISRTGNKTRDYQATESARPVADKSNTGDQVAEPVWQTFLDLRLPRYTSRLQVLLKVADPLDIDWQSLEQKQGAVERMNYDLEMLIRALGQTKRYQAPYNPITAEQVRDGIKRIRIRRVERIEQRRLEVEAGILQLHFFSGAHGSFSPDEIRAILVDRQRQIITQWINRPEAATLPPMLEEAWRNRLPLLYRNLETSIEQPIPWRIDWPSLNQAPDAARRLVYLLESLTHAASDLLKQDSRVGRRDSALEMQRAQEGRVILLDTFRELRVRGGTYVSDPVLHFADGNLELVVFQDEELLHSGTSAQSKSRRYTDIRHYPPCRKNALKQAISVSLDMKLGPYLRQVREIHLPKAKAYVQPFIKKIIAKTHYKTPERLALLEIIERRQFNLVIDWDSLLSPPEIDDKLQMLRKLETGKYNYNANYGPLFKALFHAVEEATRQDPEFLWEFLSRVEAIRYEQVNHPNAKALLIEGSKLLLRQSLLKPKGEIPHDELARKLMIAVNTMPQLGVQEMGAGMTRSDRCLDDLRQTLGQEIGVTLDDGLCSQRSIQAICRTMVQPLHGALIYLMKQSGYSSIIKKRLKRLRLQHIAPSETPGFSIHDGELVLSCKADNTQTKCLAGDVMATEINDLLALSVREKITRIETEQGNFWGRLLRERFGEGPPLVVAWETFLAHPDTRGNRLNTVNLQQAGVERLVYALTGLMDEEPAFQSEAIKRVQGVTILAAKNAESKEITLEEGQLAYHCYAGGWDGYFTIDELQLQLSRLIPFDRKKTNVTEQLLVPIKGRSQSLSIEGED